MSNNNIVSVNPETQQYMPLKSASAFMGLPEHFLREGAKEKRFPHIKIGTKYYLDVPGTRKVLASEN